MGEITHQLIASLQRQHHSPNELLMAIKSTTGKDDTSLAYCLAEALGCAYFSMQELHDQKPAFEGIQFAEAVKRNVLLLERDRNQVTLVSSNPFDLSSFKWAQAKLNCTIVAAIATQDDIKAYLTRYEESIRATDQLVKSLDAEKQSSNNSAEISIHSINEQSSPVVKLVNSTLYDALKAQASDIHIESIINGMVIKYRIDGVLSESGMYPGTGFCEEIISRIKVMAELDISERRIPQDGRFKVNIQGRDVDFRVSIMPSSHGEDAVLRILDRKSLSDEFKKLTLDTLGFIGDDLKRIRKLTSMPYGMFLVTGPTGSGKTTTLYAALTEVQRVQDKIITIEDPVEYQLQGVLQIPVNEKKGLTFARGLRSILRHDPDKIMVGEIRDAETAQIAVQSALTGHLVFTTVHANNTFDVISRFTHMGVDAYSFVSALNGVLAQRLARINCPNCLVSDRPDHGLLEASGLLNEPLDTFTFMKGQGCAQCRGIGFKGRKVVSEVLLIDDRLRQMIVDKAPMIQIKEYAANQGMTSIRQSAIELVRSGQTTLEEINRVSFVGQ